MGWPLTACRDNVRRSGGRIVTGLPVRSGLLYRFITVGRLNPVATSWKYLLLCRTLLAGTGLSCTPGDDYPYQHQHGAKKLRRSKRFAEQRPREERGDKGLR